MDKDIIKRIIRKKFAQKKQTWWTCFFYEDIDPDELHCTHKYLGELNNKEILEVKNIITSYFEHNKFNPFKVCFNKINFFGEEKNVRVLTPTLYNKDMFLLTLRKKLNFFRKDNFDSYRPHVTTDKDVVDLPFKGYALLLGSRVILKFS